MKNIIENNKLIAEFLGEKEQPYNFPQHGTLRLNGDFKTEFFDNQLQFHKDWNWLMEVVEKIESLEDNNQLMDCFKQSNKVCSLPIYTKIEAVYNACIEFIKWYNQQKN